MGPQGFPGTTFPQLGTSAMSPRRHNQEHEAGMQDARLTDTHSPLSTLDFLTTSGAVSFPTTNTYSASGATMQVSTIRMW